jgi:outer membrane protein OmpA-like peptidoglycan-associated protein
MKTRIITIAALAALVAAPALADEARTEKDKRTLGASLAAGGAVGAAVGGPPGAAIGFLLAGLFTDRELGARRTEEATARATRLEVERLDLLAERGTMRGRIEELSRALDQQRTAMAMKPDAAALADGLEFSVPFRTNSAQLPGEAEEGLEALALLLSAVPTLEIHLDGYADPRGTDRLNQHLSWARAEAVRDRLVAAGADPRRIYLNAHGAVLPEFESVDPDGWALQRRVSIRVVGGEARVAATP